MSYGFTSERKSNLLGKFELHTSDFLNVEAFFIFFDPFFIIIYGGPEGQNTTHNSW